MAAPRPAVLLQRTEALVRLFQHQVRDVLAGAGIAPPSALELELHPGGWLHVADFHPDKGAIDEVLALHPELADLFRAIAANLAREGRPAEAIRLTVGPLAENTRPAHAF